MRGRRIIAFVALAILGVVACGRDDTPERPTSTGAPGATHQNAPPAAQAPRIVELTLAFIAPHFRPDPIVLQAGEPVQFKVRSADTRHLLVIEPFGVELEVPQKSLNEAVTTKIVTPQAVGRLRMYCRLHERLPMEGTLEVRETGAVSN
jgi:heme/copper-type cytochrome/quinol oxidase subunit 2